MKWNRLKAHAIVLAGNFFFGVSVIAIKHLTPGLMPPIALNVVRVCIALCLFWILWLFKPVKPGIQKKDIPLFILCAATGVAINQILFVQGTSLTSPIHTALLMLVTPIVITILAVWFFKEKITSNKLLGLLLGVLGAVILVVLKKHADKESSAFGDILIIINAISYAFYLILAKPLMIAYRPEQVIRWVFLFGTIIIVPFGFSSISHIQWAAFQWHHWLALCFVVLGSTFLSYLFMVYGLAKLGSTVVGTYMYTQPIFATIAAMVLFNEKLTAIKLLAAIFIFGGVYLVNKQQNKKQHL